MAARKGLGRGLDGLIKNNNATTEPPKESAVKSSAINVDIKKIDRNKKQPRKKFDEDALDELSESIKQYGIIQPLLVQDRGDHYEIIAGERRWRAALKAELKEVPVIIKNLSELEIVEISLIENIQREDLDAIEEALAYKRLKTEFNMTDDQVAEKVSKSRAAVTNSMRLLKLSNKVQEMVIEGMISNGHARALLAIENADKQYEVAMDVYDRGLSVRDTEKLVKSFSKTPKKKKSNADLAKYKVHFDEYASTLSDKLGVKVGVTLKDKSNGKLEIDFYSTDDFDKIFELLNK